MTKFIKKPVILIRRASKDSAFRVNKRKDESSQSLQKQKIQLSSPLHEEPLVVPPSPTSLSRDTDDQSLCLNKIFITDITPILEEEEEEKQKQKQKIHHFSSSSTIPNSSFIKETQNNLSFNEMNETSSLVNFLEDLIDKLSMDKVITFIKSIVICLINHVMKSNYINTENSRKIHLQSFGLGVGMTSIIVIIQPFLVIYLESWIVLLGKLFKHLIAWAIIGVIISYVLNPKNSKIKTTTNLVKSEKSLDINKPLKYEVKKSTSSSSSSLKKASKSSKKNTIPNIMTGEIKTYTVRPSEEVFEEEQDFLIKEKDQVQNLERARLRVEGSRVPRNDFEQFMEAARKKEQERITHQKFMQMNKESIKRQITF